jgi:hypothetical protein
MGGLEEGIVERSQSSLNVGDEKEGHRWRDLGR